MVFDCAIVGGGPAGLTAGIYLARAGKNVIVIERQAFGGQVAEIGLIENYPGFEKISGSELSMNMYNQAKKVGVQFAFEEVVECDLDSEVKTLKTNRRVVEAKTVIIAIGSVAKSLNVSNEKKLIGKGVSYCATCDGNFFKGKIVAVAGSGDTALSNAQYLSSLCKKVYIISKYDTLKLKNTNEAELTKFDNIEVLGGVRILSLIGEDKLEGLEIEKQGKQSSIEVDGVFVSVGRTPDTELFGNKLILDEKGYIVADGEMKTNLEGVFCAGDIVSGSLKQIVTASSAGAIASTSVLKYLIKKQ